VVPAVKGNQTILDAAQKAGPQLSSVVITSSVAAIVNPKEEPEYEFTEADFASNSLEQAIKEREEGVKTTPIILYGASKTAAEREVWKFRNEHRVSYLCAK